MRRIHTAVRRRQHHVCSSLRSSVSSFESSAAAVYGGSNVCDISAYDELITSTRASYNEYQVPGIFLGLLRSPFFQVAHPGPAKTQSTSLSSAACSRSTHTALQQQCIYSTTIQSEPSTEVQPASRWHAKMNGDKRPPTSGQRADDSLLADGKHVC